jgi:hypothetical protein
MTILSRVVERTRFQRPRDVLLQEDLWLYCKQLCIVLLVTDLAGGAISHEKLYVLAGQN